MMHLKVEEGTMPLANECRQLLKAKKGKERDSVLETPEGTQLSKSLDFSAVRLISDI